MPLAAGVPLLLSSCGRAPPVGTVTHVELSVLYWIANCVLEAPADKDRPTTSANNTVFAEPKSTRTTTYGLFVLMPVVVVVE